MFLRGRIYMGMFSRERIVGSNFGNVYENVYNIYEPVVRNLNSIRYVLTALIG